MSVRRLHPDQPASFAFTDENLAYVKKVIARYPEGKQASAVIPVLMVGQIQEGWVTRPMIEAVADLLGMPHIRVLEIATFYTQFQLRPVGRVHIQVCGTTPCRLRGAGEILEICKERIAEHPFELSKDGKFSWEEVECLGACVNAPVVAIGDDTYEGLTVDSFNALVDGFDAGSPPAPGPQDGRHFCAPEGGDTALTDPALYDGSVIGKYRAFAREELKVEPAPAAPAPAPKAAETPKPPEPPKAAEAPKLAGPAVAPKLTGPAEAPKLAAPEELVSIEFKPTPLLAAKGGEADNLKKIKGVGPKLEAMLNGMGIFHFAQIAEWSEMNLKWVDQNLAGFKGRASRDGWIAQAKVLATGAETEFSKRVDAGDVPSSEG